ncbi:MAG: nucleotide sugar dehydrogenase [Pseudomonadota bacterium]
MRPVVPNALAHAVPAEFFSKANLPAISVFGLGRVGMVSAACLSALGHAVIGVDLDQTKIDTIAQGVSPIHENGLDKLLFDGVAGGLISTTDDLAYAVRETAVTLVSVGAAASNGCVPDFPAIEAVARSIGVGIAQKAGFHVVVIRSEVPPGTTTGVVAPIIQNISGKTLGKDFGLCFNPEFLRPGQAVFDFQAPVKTVVGATCRRSAKIVRQIYKPITQEITVTSVETAEMIKHVDRFWRAAKANFAQEVDQLCLAKNIDPQRVLKAVTACSGLSEV